MYVLSHCPSLNMLAALGVLPMGGFPKKENRCFTSQLGLNVILHFMPFMPFCLGTCTMQGTGVLQSKSALPFSSLDHTSSLAGTPHFEGGLYFPSSCFFPVNRDFTYTVQLAGDF